MTPTIYRDQAARLAKTNTEKASEIALKITDPWFEAQAWSHIARYADKPLLFSKRASKAASRTKDDYQRSAVRAWEITALAERGFLIQARKALRESLDTAESIKQPGSKAEALLVLFQAACRISKEDADAVATQIESRSSSTHWRIARARKHIVSMLSGETSPRDFFW